MDALRFKNGTYRTGKVAISPVARLLPSLAFYGKDVVIVFRSGAKAKRRRYDTGDWAASSLEVMRALESVGVKFEISGVDHFRTLDVPCVFIANHMSTLETFVLPAVIAPFKDVTFVVKKSLVDYPVFKYVMRSRDPITVGRENPRDDLKAVLEGGSERLRAGRSIVVFPQTTRAVDFDPEAFNTIGVKLAKRAGAPIVAVALKTDAWGNGRFFKDFGAIDPSREVHIAFDRPLVVRERGTEEHEEIIRFIRENLEAWSKA